MTGICGCYKIAGTCGGCEHFPICSKRNEKNAKPEQDYCSKPSLGYKPKKGDKK